MKLYLIRHGETDANVRGVSSGWTDTPLNENGRRLAALTGRGMGNIRFDVCISSPLSRARETAEIVLRETGNDIPVTLEPRIRELHFGTMEGVPVGRFPLLFTDPCHMPRFPEGEDISMLCGRTQAFLRELADRKDDRTYLIATHGCALRAMLNPLYPDPADFWHGHVPYNCAVSIVEAGAGQLRLVGDDVIYYDPALIVDRYAPGRTAD